MESLFGKECLTLNQVRSALTKRAYVTFRRYLPATVLFCAMSFFIYDIISDLISNDELVVFIAISIVLFHELQHVKSLSKDIKIEKSKTARLAGELLSVIREQFSIWSLTPSENEVALLLIKGLSMKEIAVARNVKEKTVHFIEDLMSEV